MLIASKDGFYSGPQTFRSGIETYQDQGLVRDESGRVVDYWRIIDGSVVRIRKLRIPTESGLKVFDMIIIQQREGNLRTQGDVLPQSTSTYISWVPNIYSWARQFWLDQYEAHFSRKRPDILEIAKGERDMYSGVSASIMVIEENDLSRIHALFRVVRKGDLPANQLLDIEKNLGEAPAIVPELRTINGHAVAIGDYVELKSMTVDKEAGIDFLPYLLMGLESADLYAFGKRTITIDGKTYPWGASTILIEAPPVQARYYKRDFGLREDPSRKKGDLSWLSVPIADFIATTKDPAKNKDRFTHSGMEVFLSEPPVSGWNYLPVPSRETKFHASYAANPRVFPDPIKRELFFRRKDVPFYRSAKYPQNSSVDSWLLDRPVLFHPFDPWKRLGFRADRPALRHISLHDIDYFVFDPKVIERVDRHHALTRFGFWDASDDLGDDFSADDLYSLYGVNGEIRRVDDPISEFRVELITAKERHAFRRAKAEAFGIPMIYFSSELSPDFIPESIPKLDPQEILKTHQELTDRGFADTRYDYDAPTLSPFEIAVRVLRDPFANYSELDWALDFALAHRLESDDLEFALASALHQLIPTAIHGVDRLLPLSQDEIDRELDRQDAWVERIFESFRRQPLQNREARKELRLDLSRAYSRTRIARLFVDWGPMDERELSYVMGNAFTEPDLTKKIIDIIKGNSEYQSHISEYSMKQLVNLFGIKKIFSGNRELTQLGGYYGPRDPVFGKNPKSDGDLMQELDQFLVVLTREWPELSKAFQEEYDQEISEVRRKVHIWHRMRSVCLRGVSILGQVLNSGR